MQRRLHGVLNGRLGQLALLLGLWASAYICGYGLVRSPKWMKLLDQSRRIYEMMNSLKRLSLWGRLRTTNHGSTSLMSTMNVQDHRLAMKTMTWTRSTSCRRSTSGMYGLLYRFGWILAVWSLQGVVASEDEAVTQRLRQRRQAQDILRQTQADLDHRWNDFTRESGIVRPPQARPANLAIARPDRDPQHVPQVVAVTIRNGMEPAIVQREVTRQWRDLQVPSETWKIVEMNAAVYNSRFYNMDYAHRILTTSAEDNANVGCVPTAVEISWYVVDYLYSGFSRPWIPTTLPAVHFLQRINMLQGCSMAYRCEIYHNGRRTINTWMYFRAGDFVHVRATLQPPPEDTESETASPMPIHRPSGSVSSSPTSSATEELTPGEYLSEGRISDVWIIYRPPTVGYRAMQMITPVTQEDRAHLERVSQFWQDLRYHVWELHAVDAAYEQDFPPSDFTHNFVLVALRDLPGPLHQVILLVVHTPVNMLIKAQVTIPQVERTILLMFARLEHFCQNEATMCRVYHNGHLLPEGCQQRVRNGDYVRITLNVEPGPRTSELMAREFEVIPDVAGFEYCEEGALAILTSTNVDPVRINELPAPPENIVRDHKIRSDEWYWIYMGFYIVVTLIFALRYFDPPKRIRTRCRRRAETMCKRQIRSTALMYLLCWQHISASAALQLHGVSVGTTWDVGGDGPRQAHRQPLINNLNGQYKLLCKGSCTYVPHYDHNFERLPPPGNPNKEADIKGNTHIGRQNLTQHGQCLCDYIGLYAMAQHIRMQFGEQSDMRKRLTVETNETARDTVQSTCWSDDKVGPFRDGPSQSDETVNWEAPKVCLPIADSPPVTPSNTHVGVAPDQKPNEVFSFDTFIDILNDDYGLVNSWDLPAHPDPLQLTLELHPSTTDKLLHPCTSPESHDTWFIFTDGSAGKGDETQGYRSSWSFAVFSGRQDAGINGGVRLIDWYGCCTDSDPLSPTWLGAEEDSIKAGESEAIMWAILWVLQAHQINHAMKVVIYSDSLTVLNTADGSWGGRENDSLNIRLRALYHLLWAVRHGRDLCIHHIRGHQGNYGNEFVDVLAKAIRLGSLEPRVPDINLSYWFHGSTPNIVFAWLPFDTDRRAEETLAVSKRKAVLDTTEQPRSRTTLVTNKQGGRGGQIPSAYTPFETRIIQCWVHQREWTNSAAT